jgi:cell division topological specificity factor
LPAKGSVSCAEVEQNDEGVSVSLFKKLLGRDWFGSESKSLAKSRLSFVLVQDRTGLTNEELAKFKREMIEVIDRYFVIDEHGFDISYQRDNDTTTLLINSPIIVRRQEGTADYQAGARTKKKKGVAQAPRSTE